MNKIANPFEILGLDRQFVSKLSVDRLNEVWKSQYRTLQKLYHPDKIGGDLKKSAELNWAKEQLSNPETFKIWKEYYVISAKRNKLIENYQSLILMNKKYTHGLLLPLWRLMWEKSQYSYLDLLNVGPRSLVVTKASSMDRVDKRADAVNSVHNLETRKRMRKTEKDHSKFSLHIEDGKLMKTEYGGEPKVYPHLLVGVVRSESVINFSGGQVASPEKMLRLMDKRFHEITRQTSFEKGHRQLDMNVARISPTSFVGLVELLELDLFTVDGKVKGFPTLFSVGVEDGNLIFFQEGTV